MRWSRSAALVSLALGLMPPAHARTPTAPVAGYGERLEAALNQGDAEAFQRLVAPSLQGRLRRRYQRLTAAFPGALWNVDRLEPMADGRSRLRVSVKGVGRSNGLMYRLQASQTLAVQLEAGVMQEEEVLDDRSLLRSGTARLPISVRMPEAVLTGSRYDIDVIVEKPLDSAVLAGGLVELRQDESGGALRSSIPLEPLGGGGLFKRVRAPQAPGVQMWAVMLVHPDGVVTTTQRVRVVATAADL